MDVNGSIFPLAFTVAANKSNETRGMFLTHLRRYVIKDHMGICVLSDRHQAILHNMFNLTGWQPPFAYHRFCLRHIKANFQTKFGNNTLNKLIWMATMEHQQKKFLIRMEMIKTVNPIAYNWLKDIDVEKWTLHADGGRRWGMLTTNSSESFNGLLKSARGLPVTAMVRMTFKQVVERFATRTRHAKAILADGGKLMPKLAQMFEHHGKKCELHKMVEYNYVERVYKFWTGYYQGRRGNLHTVYERMRTCSCGKWQSYHMPCSHAIKCFEAMRKMVSTYVASEYNVESYLKAYAGSFYPLCDQSYWPNEPFSMIANKEYIRKIHVNARTRIPDQMDVPDKTYSRRCSTCKEFGHDKHLCNLQGRGGASNSRSGRTSHSGRASRG
ncbi:uncharacterized protein LOC132057693 [Lycium ferocissimum]|uniref:uncharacterized protein LOC132057693 n=1 Tax=Lycium ferocissimum TaxID=112874 RepID=UPI0028162F2D|nr:uncharacterized protein LOC132057693 [Lycium ferocissimum]